MKSSKAAESFVYLSRNDVESLQISMKQIIDALIEMFIEKGEGRVEMPPKPGIHTRKDSFIHAMPAYIPSMNVAGLKWVSGYPANQSKGLPYITGLLIMNDPETGIPLAVMDCTWITAMRTGAATAVAAKYLARKDCSSAGILACGVQGRSNLEALACLYDLKTVKAFDIHPEIAMKFSREMSDTLKINVEPVQEMKDAVEKLDIVVTSGPILKNPDPPIPAGWLKQGSFASLVDFDSYWQGAALREADKISTDDHSQMNYYRSAGYFKDTPVAYADLGEIVAGKKPGRESAAERIISINLGIALDDMATAILIYNKALETGTGTILPL
jgi:ornithine cyclodeaminase/alanine dehydrogenase-like protein (mu-crystallin family)